jgi:hypothetical protein
MVDDEGMAAKRSAAIRDGMEHARARGTRLGRPPYKAPYRILDRIAELAEPADDGPGRSRRAIADQLNSEGVRTLSGTGQWTADRVRHAMELPKYAAVVRARQDEAYGLPPLTWNRYLVGRRFILGGLSRAVVLIPLGLRRDPDPLIGQYVRKSLLAGKITLPIGPEYQAEILWADLPTWEQYDRFAGALREIDVAQVGEFVRIEGVNGLDRPGKYAHELAAARHAERPLLWVELSRELAAAVFFRTLERLSRASDAELGKGLRILHTLCGGSGYAWLWQAVRRLEQTMDPSATQAQASTNTTRLDTTAHQ